MGNWFVFIKERFKPLEYLPLIVLFVGANILFAGKYFTLGIEPLALAKIGIMTLCFFFRMRLFDEIKDYEIDLVINPHRPLARGLLTVDKVKKGILALIAFELALGFSFGMVPALVYVFAIFYSLMMYEEFFIGDLIRPHLTTYAIAHTIVVAMLGFAIMSLASIETIFSFDRNVFYFLISHWFVFNLFEFARKTFDKDEERENVPSYSKIFTLKGACLLSLSQILFAQVAISLVFTQEKMFLLWAFSVLVSVAMLLCAFGTAFLRMKHFRLIATIYMAAHYIILFYMLWRN